MVTTRISGRGRGSGLAIDQPITLVWAVDGGRVTRVWGFRERQEALDALVPIGSTSGSGAFGRWAVDDAGLPMYRYTLDQARAPFARQPELLGRTDAWHQIGNERAIAAASNDGHVQLWSQDRRYEWVNRYDPDALQLAGGFGWLRSGATRSARATPTVPPARARGGSSAWATCGGRCAAGASAWTSASTRPSAPGRCWCTR